MTNNRLNKVLNKPLSNPKEEAGGEEAAGSNRTARQMCRLFLLNGSFARIRSRKIG